MSLSEVIKTYPNALVVSSKRYEPIVSPLFVNNSLKLVTQNELVESKEIADAIKNGGFTHVIAVGSGKAIDSAKYACYLENTYLIVVPACLSTNCFFTDKSTLFDGAKKHTTDSRIPDEIVFDWELISHHMLMNMCGVVELLSSATALADWRIAFDNDKEKINQKIYDGASKLVVGAVEMLDEGKYNMEKHVEMLATSGDLVIEYQTGRPVSGSDHIISSYIESFYRCPHGIALYMSIPIGLTLQKYAGYPTEYSTLIPKLLALPEFKEFVKNNMSKDDLIKQLVKIVPRADRFSIIDIVTKDQILQASEEVLNVVFS